MIITFLDKVSKKHTLQYLLTLINDILTEDPSRIGLFLECSKQLGKMSWETFLHIVETKEDLYVQHQVRVPPLPPSPPHAHTHHHHTPPPQTNGAPLCLPVV